MTSPLDRPNFFERLAAINEVVAQGHTRTAEDWEILEGMSEALCSEAAECHYWERYDESQIRDPYAGIEHDAWREDYE
jgi:hypothetical protein